MSRRQSFETDGDKSRPAILFLHGGGLNRKMWHPQMRALADDYFVMSIDLPGHGELRESFFSIESAVRNIHSVIKDEIKGRAIIVGLSLGGYVAIVHSFVHSDQVAGLVLSGCSVVYSGFMRFLAETNLFLLKFISQERFSREQENIIGKFPDAIANPVIEAGFSLEGGRDSMREVIGKDFYSMLSSFHSRSIIVNGENDFLNRQHENSLLASATQSSIITIPNAGHLCSLEQPGLFADAVRAFAGDCRFS